MAVAVYILCAVTSCLCAVILLRRFYETRIRLLFWTGLCFVCLALNNLFLIADLVIFPESDYSVARNLVGAIGVSLLVYGLLSNDKARTLKGAG